jgi:hypothetical protein
MSDSERPGYALTAEERRFVEQMRALYRREPTLPSQLYEFRAELDARLDARRGALWNAFSTGAAGLACAGLLAGWLVPRLTAPPDARLELGRAVILEYGGLDGYAAPAEGSSPAGRPSPEYLPRDYELLATLIEMPLGPDVDEN